MSTAQFIYDNTFYLLEAGRVITTSVFRLSNINICNSFIHINQHIYDPNINLKLRHMQMLVSQNILYNRIYTDDTLTQMSRITASFLTVTHGSAIYLKTLAGATIEANNLLITNVDVVGNIIKQYLGIIPTIIQNHGDLYNIIDINNKFEQCFLHNYYMAKNSHQPQHILILHEEIYKYLLDSINNVPNIEEIKNTRIIVKGGIVNDRLQYDAFTFKNNLDIQNIILNNNLTYLNNNHIDLKFKKL